MELAKSAEIQDQYMNLLVTQLQNQDPLEPVSQENFISQLTQFSNLASMEQLNASFSTMVQLQTDALKLQEMSASSNLVGREVDFHAGTNPSKQTGTVSSVEVADGRVMLKVGEQSVSVDQIVSVR